LLQGVFVSLERSRAA